MCEFFRSRQRCQAAAPIQVVLTLFCLAATAVARSQSPAPAPQADASAPADAQKTITIHVQIADNKGHLVPGLQESDFTLLDNKQPQKLLGFRAVDAAVLKSDPVSVVLAVDMINSDIVTVSREREEIGRFLKLNGGELANPTSLAVIEDRGLKAGQQSTQNGNLLFTAFSQTQSAIRELGRDAGFWGATERMEKSLTELRQLIGFEGQQPGRKLVLLISPGWPLLIGAGDQADMHQRGWIFNNLVQLTNQLREANVTLYCIDPRDLGRTNPFEYQGYLKGVGTVKDATYPDLGLQVLATHTGGQVLINGRDISGQITDAIRDVNPSYDLTFAPAPGDRVNEYHALDVRVDKPGLKVRTTAGYYARTEAVH